MIKRGLDCGGSTTRLGIREDLINCIPSLCVEIDKDSPVKNYMGDDKLCDFLIEKHPYKAVENRRFVKGEALNHYQGKTLICDNQGVKVEQDTTYINAAYALAAQMMQGYLNNVEVIAGSCIPTSEFYSEKQDFAEIHRTRLFGDYQIYFPLIGDRVNFRISQVAVVPEGVVAVYKYHGDKKMTNKITLIVDVGQRSTDITILKGFAPVGKAAVSRPKGGINIEAFLKNTLERDNIFLNAEQIRVALERRYIIEDGSLEDISDIVEKFDYDVDKIFEELIPTRNITREDIIKACNNYFISYDNSILDITDYVVDAKKVFASSLKSDIIDVLAIDMMNLQSVDNIVPIGRPFSGQPTSKNNLISILLKELDCDINCYKVGNLGTANVKEIMRILGSDDDK